MSNVFNLSVSFFQEGNQVVAYVPVLDLSTCGKTFTQAKKRINEAVDIFFEELEKKGTLEETLLDLGWQKKNNQLISPIAIAHEVKQMAVAA